MESIRAALAHVQAGESVLVAQPDNATLTNCPTAVVDAGNLMWHLASFAVMDRAAFVPLLFTGHGMQPVRARPSYAALDTSASTPVPIHLLEASARADRADAVREILRMHDLPDYFIGWPDRFDHVLLMHGGCAAEPSVDVPLDLLAEGEIFSLYRIRRAPMAGRAPRV